MKKRSVRILLMPPALFMLLLLNSCTNDIELFRKNQDKTYVVFGLLNSNDVNQQVKVRMTSVTDAPITDIVADSSEFSASPNLQVSIQEWQNNNCATFNLVPVFYSKEPGIFMNTRNNLYEVLITPSMDMDYKLLIINPENGDQVTSKIVPVAAPKLGAPTWQWIRYNFSLDADPFNVRFYEVPRAYVYIVRFTIRYIEVITSGDTVFRQNSYAFKPVFVDDPPQYSPTRENLGNEHNQHMNRNYTYGMFDQIIPDRPEVSFRQLICFELSVWAGDQNLRNYTEFGIKFNDNRKQLFTNINNGIGFFGACSHADCTGVLPDQDFLDSLPHYYRTSRLKFLNSLYETSLPSVHRPNDSFISIIREIRNEQ